MRNKKGIFARTCAVVLSLAMTVATVGVPTESEAASKPKLAKKTISVKKGKTAKITIKGKKIKKTTWSVKNKKIVKLTKKKKTSVKVKGLKAGSTKVTAKVKVGKKTYKLKATVKVKNSGGEADEPTNAPASTTSASSTSAPGTSAPANSAGASATTKPTIVPTPEPPISLDQSELTLNYYKSATLTAKVKDSQETPVWTSSDESVATVKDGVVTAVGEDNSTAIITASIRDASATCKVTVKKIPMDTVVVKDDFEDGTSQYTTQRSTSEDPTVEVADGGSGGSSKCFKVTNRVSTAQGALVDLTDICEPGSTYDFSADIKAGGTISNENLSLIISSEIRAVETGSESYDNLAVITAKKGNFQGAAEEHYADPLEWNEINYTFTAPDDMYHFGLYLETKLDAKCDLFIDNIKITLKDRNVPDYSIESLSESYKDVFENFGVGAGYDSVMGDNAGKFIQSQFDAFTPGNCYKPDAILTDTFTQLTVDEAKAEGYYIPEGYADLDGNKKSGTPVVPALDFTRVDQVLERAHELGLKVRFHTLVWHQQTSAFFFKDKYKLAVTADNADPETMDSRLDYYINNVMNHVLAKDLELAGGDKSKCKLYAIDVVNEYTHSHMASDKTVNTNGTTYYEEIYGKKEDGSYIYDEKGAMSTEPAYVKWSFKLANEALKANGREDITLVYNDFNTYFENTTQEIIDLAKYINAKDDINTEGEELCQAVGMQMHLTMGDNHCSVESIQTAVDKFIGAGLQIEVTEWDAGVTGEEKLEDQGKYYKDIMKMFIERKDHVKTMILWSLYDAVSWRASSYPCVFKGLYNVKPAYTGLMEAVKEAK